MPQILIDFPWANKTCLAMLDSGSSSSVSNDSVVSEEIQLKESKLEISTMTGGQLEILGAVKGNAHKGAATIGRSTRVHVTSNDLQGFDVVLGSDWLTANKAVLDFRSRVVVIGQHVIPFVATRQRKESFNLTTVQKPHVDVHPMYQGADVSRLYVHDSVSLNPESCVMVKVSVPESLVQTWVTPRDILVTLPEQQLADRGVAIGGALLRMSVKQPTALIWVMNVTRKEIELKSGDTLAFATVFPCAGGAWDPGEDQAVMGGPDEGPTLEVRQRQPKGQGVKGGSPSTGRCFRCLKSCCHSMQAEKARKRSTEISEDEYHEMVNDLVARSECPEDHRKEFRQMLWKHRFVLARDYANVGLCTAYQPGIPLDTDEPIYTPQYPIPHKMRGDMGEQVQELNEAGIVIPSTSPYNSPTLMVPKTDGGWRMVVDFRRLNQHVITDPHPLPRIQNILEDLGGSVFFTAIDLLAGFYNLKIRPQDRHKTAFSTPEGHWEFVRLPMGLKNSPSVFQRLMNIVLTGCLGVYSYIYVDDVIIYSKTVEDHMRHLDDIFSRLRKVGLKIKAAKCQMFKTSIKYLGFIVGQDGLRINPKKLEAITCFPRPTNVKAVQGFLGLTGYFRTFILQYAQVAKPLYDLLKQDRPWKWGKEQEEAFETLKMRMVSAPVLAFPDFSRPFVLTTDASATALGAVLTQEVGKKHRLVSCASRLLKGAELRYSNTDREILAAVYGIKAHRSYLWGYRFTLRTDHMALTHLNRNLKDNARAMRWHLDVSEYDFILEHKRGISIPHADVLSRYPPPKKTQATLAYLSPSLQSTDLVPILDTEAWVTEVAGLPKATLPVGEEVVQKDGLFWKKVPGQDPIVWVPPSQRGLVMRLFHEPPAVGHPGVDRMLYSMKNEVFWTGMKRDVESFVKGCDKCLRYKHHKQSLPWLSTPVPLQPFEDISIDIVGPVPSSRRGNREILVIQDRLTRWIEFVPMCDMTAHTVARALLNNWVCRYGVPKRLISDRGRQFVSEVFAQMCKFLGIKNFTTTAYRPSSNGQNERSHRELHAYIAMYVTSASHDAWDTLLQQAAWVHNSSKHEALQASPFELVTGLKPRTMNNAMNLDSKELKAFSKFYGVDPKKLEEIRTHAKNAIQRGQERMMGRLNIDKRIPTYNIGDLVYVRSHNYTTFVARKWSPKFIGPYKVIEIVNPVVIRIQHVDFPDWENTVHVAFVRPVHPRSKSPPPSHPPSPFQEFEDEQAFESASLIDKGLVDEHDVVNTVLKGNGNAGESVVQPTEQFVPRHAQQLAEERELSNASSSGSSPQSFHDPDAQSFSFTPRSTKSVSYLTADDDEDEETSSSKKEAHNGDEPDGSSTEELDKWFGSRTSSSSDEEEGATAFPLSRPTKCDSTTAISERERIPHISQPAPSTVPVTSASIPLIQQRTRRVAAKRVNYYESPVSQKKKQQNRARQKLLNQRRQLPSDSDED